MTRNLAESNSHWVLTGVVVCILLGLATGGALAQSAEYRAYWVDAWHAGFKTAAECDQLVSNVQASNCNTVIVQMRRRGDTYYPSTYEPFATDADTSFDALQYLIDVCHSRNPRIQVHAWLVYIPVWNSTTAPTNPNHPFNKYPQYLSKNDSGATWDGSDYQFDPGNPNCEQYLTNIVTDIASRYNVDGISFDYSRFSGNRWGYNATSVSRFNARYSRTGTPAYTDSTWSNWRRTQITNLIRKAYLESLAIKPSVIMSSAVVTWHPTPTEAGSFEATSPYTSCFQNWKGWMSEGIVDLAIPMNYFDKDGSYAADYDAWSNFAKAYQYSRGAVIGPGVYMNDITDSISQIRQTRTSYSGYVPKGVAMYSYAVTNDQGLARSTFINALTHTSSYDTNPTPVFSTAVSCPTLSWKSSPTKGHLKGTIRNNGSWLDGATVSITGPASKSTTADGTGYYGFVDLTPGTYTVTASYTGLTSKSSTVAVTAGRVSDISLDLGSATSDIIIDNNSSSFYCSANWSTGTSSTDKYGTDYRYHTVQAISDAAIWTPNIPTAGTYAVYAWWPQGTNRSSSAPYIINYNGGSQTVYVNQQINGGKWNLLGTYSFAAGTSGNVQLSCWTTAQTVVMADAVRFVKQ